MKTITMMDLRKAPGEYAHLVNRHGQTIVVTSQGKPVFKMVPVDDTTVIGRHGELVSGPDIFGDLK